MNENDISRSNGKFITSVYRKRTFTGLFTNFHSFIPLNYKRSLVSSLLHRIFNLCSSYENFHVQLEVIRKLLKLYGFPSHMFDFIARRFLDSIFQPKPSIPNLSMFKVVLFLLTYSSFPSFLSSNCCTVLSCPTFLLMKRIIFPILSLCVL